MSESRRAPRAKNIVTGQRLREERLRRDLTQPQLAELLGVTPGAVSHFEVGRRPLDSVIWALSRLGFDVDYITTGRRAEPNQETDEDASRPLPRLWADDRGLGELKPDTSAPLAMFRFSGGYAIVELGELPGEGKILVEGGGKRRIAAKAEAGDAIVGRVAALFTFEPPVGR